MDEKDRLLLTYLRNGLPLTPRPFNDWAAKIGRDGAELLVRIQRLKREGVLGEIKAILDPRAFHYQSAWVAVKGSPSCAEIFGKHPGVVYCCERDSEFNIWFFMAVPPDHDLELHARCLEKLAGTSKALFLPVGAVFKGIDFLSSWDAGTFLSVSERFEKRSVTGPSELTLEEIRMIRQLQEAFPLTDEPYRKIAADLGMTENEALERIKALVKKGYLKRIGSFLKSAAALPVGKALVVWQIPEEKLERIGPEIAGFREVLYADRRPALPEFPYALYTVLRSGTPGELEALTRRIQDRIGKWPSRVLTTVREFKKERIKYFPKELDGWWRENRPVIEAVFN